MEVAHDMQLSVSKYITQALNLLNSYDTWHGNIVCAHESVIMYIPLHYKGTKNVDKLMKKITEGRVRDRGATWFPQLLDKSEHNK